jgi:2-methylfumaryl-CoA isomerase
MIMYPILEGLRIIEASSFVAAPSCGLYLRQLGAELIRVDAIDGALDGNRWPLAPNGSSLYWEGLNKGKKSVSIDLRAAEGRALLYHLIVSPGEQSGILLTNYPADGFLAYDKLRVHRPDLIVVRVMGRWNGGSGLDYTVNAAYGLPFVTGPAELGDRPVNHVLPAWDLLTGAYAAFALMAAIHHRSRTGEGQEVRISLEDIAVATLGNLGSIAETTLTGTDRPRSGNALYGAFGRDFTSSDGRRVMIVAITARQWTSLVEALDLAAPIASLERALGVSFTANEGARYVHRDHVDAIVEAAVSERIFESLAAAFDKAGVCWSPYNTLQEALVHEPACSTENPLLAEIDHPSGYRYPTPGAPVSFSALARQTPTPAPALGADGGEILSQILGLSPDRIAELTRNKIVGSRPGK